MKIDHVLILWDSLKTFFIWKLKIIFQFDHETYQNNFIHAWIKECIEFSIWITVQPNGFRKTEDPSRPYMVNIYAQYVQNEMNSSGILRFHLGLPSSKVLHRAQVFWSIQMRQKNLPC